MGTQYPSLDAFQQSKNNCHEQSEHEPFIIGVDDTTVQFRSTSINVSNGSIPNGHVRNGVIPTTGDIEDRQSARSGSVGSRDSGLGGEKRQSLLAEEGNGGEKDSTPENINNEDSFWKKVLIIFSILNVLLFITILVVALGIPSHQPGHSAPDDDGHCLPCMDVYLTDDDKLDNIYDFQIKDDLCCSENQTKLIQKYVIKRYRSDQAKESAKNYVPQRTAVHLPVDVNDNSSIYRGANQVLKWEREGSLINGNLSLSTDGREIVVKRTGIYYISPKVIFRDGTVDVVDKDLLPMLLQVVRKRSGEEQVLLENKHTHCANSKGRCDVPSSSQGVFRLSAEDSLIIRVTKPCPLALEPGLNYIDVYMI